MLSFLKDGIVIFERRESSFRICDLKSTASGEDNTEKCVVAMDFGGDKDVLGRTKSSIVLLVMVNM